MSGTYVIQWKSKINGRAGRGTKLFKRNEAEELASELNREYPNIDHEIMKMEGRDSVSPDPDEGALDREDREQAPNPQEAPVLHTE